MDFFLRNFQPSPRCANLLKFLFIFFLAGVAPLIVHLDGAHGQTAGTWTTSGSLNTARMYHTSTLLPNGKVLVAGGQGSVGLQSSCEIFDPAANGGVGAWTATASLTSERHSHTATLLPNGEVLVAGGRSSIGYGMSSAVLYNYTTGTWTATGFFTYARSNHTATLLPNGNVLIAGGLDFYGQPMNSAAVYDPATGTWTTSGSLNTDIEGHTATLLPNGKVLVAGGGSYAGNPTITELYDPARQTWTDTGSLNTVRYHHTATLLPNGKVLVAGGDIYEGPPSDSCELYASPQSTWTAATGTWVPTGSLSNGRAEHTATLLGNGKVLVAGGGNNDGTLANAKLYDPVGNSWADTGPLPSQREDHTATLLANGKVLVVGGGDINGVLDTAAIYDPVAGTWTATESINYKRAFHTATLLPNGKVLVAGGYGTSGAPTSALIFDPNDNNGVGTWTPTEDLIPGRNGHTATLLPNGKVLVAGGEYDSGYVTASAELYDPSTGTWSDAGPSTGTPPLVA